MQQPAPSLRERQRAEIRREIHACAMRLMAERGFDSVTTDEIAAAAGVSPSTYYRHVASKEDLLLRPVVASGANIVVRFDERPAAEPAHIALARAISEQTKEAVAAEVAVWRSAIQTAPDLMARVTLISEADRDALVSGAARRMDADDTSDFQPGLMVAVVLATAEHAYRRWLTNPLDRGRPLAEMIDEMLAMTCAGTWGGRDDS